DAAAAVAFIDREVVDVELAARLLELAQLIGAETAHHAAVHYRDQRNEAGIVEQALQVVARGTRSTISLWVLEGGAEEIEQPRHQAEVLGRQALDLHSAQARYDWNRVPAPAARARVTARSAMAVSCTPVPVRSQIRQWSSLWRPGFTPATTWPSSGK